MIFIEDYRFIYKTHLIAKPRYYDFNMYNIEKKSSPNLFSVDIVSHLCALK